MELENNQPTRWDIMKKLAHRRHDISDRVWNKIEPHLPGRKGGWGRSGEDNRSFINGVLWIMRTGAPWRDLPPDLGNWNNVNRRFCRWRDKLPRAYALGISLGRTEFVLRLLFPDFLCIF